jgi:hypothetical protein
MVLGMELQELPQVDIQQLVTIETEDGTFFVEEVRGEAQPASSAQPFGLGRRDDLDAEAVQGACKGVALAVGAAHDDPAYSRSFEQPDLVSEERPAGDVDE